MAVGQSTCLACKALGSIPSNEDEKIRANNDKVIRQRINKTISAPLRRILATILPLHMNNREPCLGALISRFDIWIAINFFLWQIYMLFSVFIWCYLLSGCYLRAEVALWQWRQPGNLLVFIRRLRDIKSHLTYLRPSNFIHILSAVNLIPQHFLG